jgi:hypothetical protein
MRRTSFKSETSCKGVPWFHFKVETVFQVFKYGANVFRKWSLSSASVDLDRDGRYSGFLDVWLQDGVKTEFLVTARLDTG